MNVLHICANPKPMDESVSKQLSVTFISTLIEKVPDVEINNIDLYQDPPPFLDYSGFRGAWNPVFEPSYKPTKAEQTALTYSVRHAELFNQADVLVLTMPMWNFSAPAIMKAWIDQILLPNKTFTFGPDGVTPLHHIKKIVLLVSSGGVYSEDDARDALSAQIRAAFDFIKITEISIAWADGQTAMFFGDHAERKQTALEAAEEIAVDLADEFENPEA
ncbi:MAG: NAD(P)H-dependent oxidoreductase [Kiritimatiellia bacterium]|nr:NAD(P)H-dependent oxidoreductase [Kiritimatiellia bacterium]